MRAIFVIDMDEIGAFHLGSTVVVLVGANATLSGETGPIQYGQERRQAPQRVSGAERLLKEIPGLTVRSAVLEGDPGKALVEEAERSKAHLIVVGSHAYGPFKRLALGSVSQHVAAHVPCSVEIVRCPHGDALVGDV